MAEDTSREFGNYRVIRPLGQGGMGRVYEVEHKRLGVRYALKVFERDDGNAEFLRKRFLAEGRILARIVHPRIVRVYDMDVTDGHAWFTMDYVEGPKGQPLTLADFPQAGGTAEARLWSLYEDIAEALEVIRIAGIVHRDIKLENVLIGRDGRAILSDFGISRIVDEKFRRELAVTRTMATKDADLKLVLGTPAYLAPELRHGGEPTHASDLYAVGVMFYRLLTGIWYEPGPHSFDLLRPFNCRWRKLLTGLLNENPAVRHPSVPAGTSFVRNRWRIGLLFIIGLALAFALGALLGSRHGHRPPPPTATDSIDEDYFSIPQGIP